MIQEPHKRYLLFQVYEYYPSGGIYDLKDSFDTVEEAIKASQTLLCDFHIYDRIEGVLIEIT